MAMRIVTEDAGQEYYVGKGGVSVPYRWKAWRDQRPLVIGYGLTEQEAIDDLKYRVQPDHTGELDGEGAPSGPLIGGNMFGPSEIVVRNKAAFDFSTGG